MPGVSTVFPATAAFLRKTIRPGLTIGKSIILVCYSAIMLYAGLFRSNPLSEPVRAGFVTMISHSVEFSLYSRAISSSCLRYQISKANQSSLPLRRSHGIAV